MRLWLVLGKASESDGSEPNAHHELCPRGELAAYSAQSLNVLTNIQFLLFPCQSVREGVKNPSHGNRPLREGGCPLFPLTFFCSFFATNRPLKGGRGVPPFSVKKKSVKYRPTNCEFCFRILALSSRSVVLKRDMSIYANIYRF